MSDGEGFLSRWSKRKMGREAAAKPDTPVAPPAPPTPPAAPAATPASTPAAGAPELAAAPMGAAQAALARPAAARPKPEAPPLPSLDDVAKLNRESDYAPYVNLQVDPQVRNAAMKKLFSDPHFNVMDGLDTYIDDYGKPDPLPLSMIRQMTSARALGLFADEEAAEAKALAAAQTPARASAPAAQAEDAAAKANPDSAPPAALAQSPIERRPPADALRRPPPVGVEETSGGRAFPQEFEPRHEDTDLRLQPDDAAGRPSPDPGAGRPG